MGRPAELLRHVRTEAGLSRTALAGRAGVPTSTVSRIEDSQMEPTLTMLDRLVTAAGLQLRIEVTAQDLPTLARLAVELAKTATETELNWVQVRSFLDHLDQHPELVETAIAVAPQCSHAHIRTLLAGIADELAERAGLPHPRWTRSVKALAVPWHAPGTPLMIARAKARAPKPLRDRNMWIACDGLWHERR